MKKFNKEIKKITNLRKYNKESDVIAKIISLSYLTTSTEHILHDKFNKHPERDIIKLINKSVQLFHTIKTLSTFQKKNFESLIKVKGVLQKHKQLWQNIWPAYETKSEFQELIDFRIKRFKLNNITKLYKNKKIIEFGCGNGSISMGCIQTGAKSSYATDIGKNNIKFAKTFSKKLKINKKITFEVKDILKMKNGKNNYDFLICSAVLHHLKNFKDFDKAIKKISSYAKNKAFFFIYVAGKGGMRDSIQKRCVENFQNVSEVYIRKVLFNLNFTRAKITHLVDWFKADYLECTESKLEKILLQNNFYKIKRLKGPHKTDMDDNQMKEHKYSRLKFGTGDLRYLFQFKK